ncbi:MAG TPA: MarR family transcriptional regulator [Actinomycetota bacterium]|jgi:DNA-binding MarR family transcriptional regulator|nr:MarR family transcriptional regulator [Actinomycetota bacterium]
MESQQTTPSLVPLTVGGRPSLPQGDPGRRLPAANPGLSLAREDADAPGTSSADCVQSLQRIEGLLAGRMNNLFRPYGLSTATFNVILVLSRAGGSLSPCDIGEQLSVTRGTVTGLLDSLERQRLVRRTPHPKDRRMLTIELTDEGRNILDRLMPEHVQGMCELLACLSESEKKAFAGVLAKIQDHLHASGSPTPAQH